MTTTQNTNASAATTAQYSIHGKTGELMRRKVANPRESQTIKATAYDAVYADREELMEAMRQIVSANETRGRGKPVARAANLMADIAKAAIEKAKGRNW